MAKSLPRKVKVGFRVAMASQPFIFVCVLQLIPQDLTLEALKKPSSDAVKLAEKAKKKKKRKR